MQLISYSISYTLMDYILLLKNNMNSNITSNTRMCRRSYDVLGISKTTMMYLESLFADLDFFQFRDDESLK